MASLLRQIVAGPRSRHPEAGLDLCYVTDFIIATSGPSSTYPQRAYRNPTDGLVKFLDYKHGANWAIWEFRAEGTGYPDSEVYNRIRHYPWPDHHPPPFALIPNIMASMRDWLKGPEAKKGRVTVVHCKAGKGRSGTVACSYLISEDGWTLEDAMKRFTARRMRSGFGNGLSIPSQMRWVGYVDWWAKHGKVYVEREVEILEIHVHGLRDGVKVSVEGYVEEGKVIKTFHTFTKEERILMDVPSKHDQSTSIGSNTLDEKTCPPHESNSEAESITTNTPSTTTESTIQDSNTTAALFRPATPITLPSSDVNIAFERRNAAIYGFTMVTSVAHVWFNIFFESQYATSTSSQTQKASPTTTDNPTPTDPSTLPTSGVFSIPWEDMDGIRGSPRKGARALDRLSVVWRCPSNPNPRTSNAPSQPPTTLESAHSIAASSPQPTNAPGKIIPQPPPGAQIPEAHPADWRQPRSSQPAS